MTQEQRTRASSDSAPVQPLEDMEDNNRYLGKEVTRWKEKQKSFREAIDPDSVNRLAADWGVSEESLNRLGIGFDASASAYTFAMFDSQRQVVGIRRRPYKDVHRKYSAQDSTLGLFIPAGVTPGNAKIIGEGESDTAAALTAGIPGIGIPGASHAIEHVCAFFTCSPVACPCIMADDDQDGKDGAEKLAAAMVAAGIPCRVLTAPAPHGDLRDWVTKGHATAAELLSVIGQQPIRWPDNWPPGFVIVPNAPIRRGIVAQIGPGPFALACILKSHWCNGRSYPAREVLARELGVSIATVDRYKGTLEKAGILAWRRGHTGRTNEYDVNLGPRRKPNEKK